MTQESIPKVSLEEAKKLFFQKTVVIKDRSSFVRKFNYLGLSSPDKDGGRILRAGHDASREGFETDIGSLYSIGGGYYAMILEEQYIDEKHKELLKVIKDCLAREGIFISTDSSVGTH